MASYEHRHVISGYIEDEFPFISLVLVDCDLAEIEVFEDVLKQGYGGIRDMVEFLLVHLHLIDLFDALVSNLKFFSHQIIPFDRFVRYIPTIPLQRDCSMRG